MRQLPRQASLEVAVGAPLRCHAGGLARGELEHAVIVRVIHEVGNRVDAWIFGPRTRVSARGATISSRLLRRRVIHAVTRL